MIVKSLRARKINSGYFIPIGMQGGVVGYDTAYGGMLNVRWQKGLKMAQGYHPVGPIDDLVNLDDVEVILW